MKKFFTSLLVVASLTVVTAQRDFRVRFLGHTEIFPENFSKILTEKPPVAPDEICGGHFFRYLQFSKIPSAADRREMESVGIRLLDYYSFGCYWAAFPADFDFEFLKKFEPRSLVAGQSDWKISRKLLERPLPEWAVAGDEVAVVLQVFPTISISEAADRCRREGISISMVGNQNGILQVKIKQSDIEKTAALPFVKWLEPIARPGEPEDTGGRSIHRSNLLDSDSPMGRKYNGFGVGVLCRDDGPVGPHIDFEGRITNLANPRPGETHGDGVSGIMAGAGNLNPSQKGMAAGADLFVIDYVNHFQDNTLDLHFDENVLVTNSSYSDGCNDGYTTTTQTVDKQVFENPTLMHVFSAGNNNGANCDYGAGNQWGNITGGHKMGKNVIATANLFADGVLAGSSSRGPAHDGRLKPDIAAHGQEQGSTTENNEYQVFGGTSGAAPGIAGCLAQLQQAHRELEGGDAPSALLKAAILATANDMGRPGPDFKFGWGHINAHRAVQVLEKKNWVRASVGQGTAFPFILEIPKNVRQARVMVYWAERESAVNAAVALVNDLDLTATDGAGKTYLPLVLDHTPDAAKLDLPATPREDHLNNVEQIRLDAPDAGQYIFTIAGTEVPFGPQEFFIVWDFLDDSVELTYPSGGEGLLPGEGVRLHWDAFGDTANFDISFAADGQNFQNITTVAADLRMWVWDVPQGIVTSKAKLKIERGGQSFEMAQPFSIVRRPSDLQVVRVCPDSITVKYRPASDTLATDIYLLGKKYMEIVSSKIDSVQTFYFKNDGKEKWLAARTSDANGLTGRRTLAVRYPGGLNDCPQQFDGSLANVLEPAIAAIVRCDAFDQPVKIRVNNDGQQPMEGATASYQVDNQAIETELLPDIAAGESLDFEFSKKLTLAGVSGLNLKIWVTQAGDANPFNDTLNQFYPVVTQPATGFYTMNFQNLSSFPPLGWIIDNPDNSITWAQGSATGTSGSQTTGAFLNCWSYVDRGQEDALYMIPVDLSAVEKPALAFSLAHARYNFDRTEQLRVEVFEDCDLTKTPVKVFEKIDPALATAANQTSNFTPNETGDWRTEVVDLQQFKNKTVIIRFVGTSDQGNNIWLDNVRILEYNLQPPKAGFIVPEDSICRAEEVIFSSTSTGSFLTYAWLFGAQSVPTSATGAGPHDVYYNIPGKKNVRLIVTNPLGADTLIQNIFVRNTTAANFSQSVNQNTVVFTNSSTNADTFFWEFGDGQTSTEKSPTHVYASTGTFSVKMTAQNNACDPASKTASIEIKTVGTGDLAGAGGVRLSPNPTSGDFVLEMNLPAAATVAVDVVDARGSRVRQFSRAGSAGLNRFSVENLGLPAGVYQLKIFTGESFRVLSLAVN